MKVLLAKSAGFCYGVERAVELAEMCIRDSPYSAAMDVVFSFCLYTLAPLSIGLGPVSYTHLAPPQTRKLHTSSMAGGLFSYTGSFCRFLPICAKRCWDSPSAA